MSLLIAVKSCQQDRQQGFHEAIRETWANGAAIRFFMGGDATGMWDETSLGCRDDYEGLPFKTKAILEWFLKHESASHIFLCDNDTFVYTKRLLRLEYDRYDYFGVFTLWPHRVKMGETFKYEDGRRNVIDPCYPWASGGYGYFLSRKAAEIIVQNVPNTWAEDLWVGQVLGPRADVSKCDGRYHNNTTWHWNKPKAGPFTVYKLREAFKNGPLGQDWSPR